MLGSGFIGHDKSINYGFLLDDGDEIFITWRNGKDKDLRPPFGCDKKTELEQKLIYELSCRHRDNLKRFKQLNDREVKECIVWFEFLRGHLSDRLDEVKSILSSDEKVKVSLDKTAGK